MPSAVTPNIRFDGNAASGQAGCNTFNAVANIQGDQLRFDTVQTTKNPCEDPMATVEAAFLQALNLSTTVHGHRATRWSSPTRRASPR